MLQMPTKRKVAVSGIFLLGTLGERVLFQHIRTRRDADKIRVVGAGIAKAVVFHEVAVGMSPMSVASFHYG